MYFIWEKIVSHHGDSQTKVFKILINTFQAFMQVVYAFHAKLPDDTEATGIANMFRQEIS